METHGTVQILCQSFRKLMFRIRTLRVGNGHSIVEIVMHMVAWRKFVTERLKGNNDFDIDDQNNFPSMSDCQKAKVELKKSQ